MLPMRLLRARRKSGGSRAAVGRWPGSGFRSAPLFAGTPLRCKGPPGPVSRLRQGLCGSGSVPCPARVSAATCAFLRAPLRLRHVCFAAVPSAARAAALQSLLCLLFCGPFVQRGADAAFFAPCGPRLRRVSRIGGPASRLASETRLPASLLHPGIFAAPVGGRDRPVRIRPPPVRRRTPAAGAASRPCRAFPGPAAGANRR